MEILVVFAIFAVIAYLILAGVEWFISLIFGKLKYRNLSWVAIMTFSLLAAIIFTDVLLGSLLTGNMEAFRMIFPFPGSGDRSYIERILGAEERYRNRNIYAALEEYKTFGKEIEQNSNEAGYSNEQKFAKQTCKVKPDIFRPHLYGYKLFTENLPESVTIKYPYLDSFFLPLFKISDTDKLAEYFPYLTISNILGLELPGGLYSIGLLYELNENARYKKEQKLRRSISMFLVPALSLAIFLFLYNSYKVDSQTKPEQSSLFSLATFVQLFLYFFPLLFLFELTQPTCYRPGSGRTMYEQKPKMKVVANEILDTFSSEGKIDSETHELIKAAMEDPSSFVIKE